MKIYVLVSCIDIVAQVTLTSCSIAWPDLFYLGGGEKAPKTKEKV